jgi:twitching motility protein PilJ
MTTTQPNISDEPPIITTSQPRRLGGLRLNSIGSRLFVYVLGATVVGLGGMAILFYNTLKSDALKQLQIVLSNEASQIDGRLAEMEQASSSMAIATKHLRDSNIQTPDIYKKLLAELFHARPKLAMAAGFGQAPYQLIKDRKGFYPYFYTTEGVPEAEQKGIGEALPAPFNQDRYVDVTQENYFQQGYYTEPVAAKQKVWTEPYDWYGLILSSHVRPFYDQQGKLLGVAGYDVNVTRLVEQVKKPVRSGEGYFAIVSNQGKLLAYPPNPLKAQKLESYETLPELKAVWPQLQQGSSGLITQQGNNYWVYQRIPTTNWLLLASIPKVVVSRPVQLIAIGGTLLVAGLLAASIAVFVRMLNRRLKPILDECSRLATTDPQSQVGMHQQDEIGQLSTSFFNLVQQLSENEEQLKQEITHTREVQTQVEQQATQIEADNLVLQSDVEYLLETVSAVEEGDLTVQAPVSDRVTGLVADTFNRLVEELANVMAQVSDTTQQVTQRSLQLNESASTVAQNTQQQAHEVGRVLNLTEQAQRSAQDSATQIELTNQSLAKVRATIEQGQLAINTLTQGIQTLQAGAGQMMKRTTDLDEFVSVTDQFVQEQSQVAELIQSLAMSATLLSARATAQQDPRQMMVIAKEFETIAYQIKSLAEQTNRNLGVLQKRTDLIQNTVSSITQDLQGIDGLVGGFRQGVEKSSHAFGSIQSATADVVKTGQAIAQSSQQIVQISQDTATAMRGMAQLAGKTAQLTQQARSQSEQMEQISEQLQQRVQFFRLPAITQQARSPQPESSHTAP